MSTYLIKMTPLEPFTFGGERGFDFGDKSRAVSYYQTSKEMPEQTTIIGMLRYLALKNKGLLKDFSEYTEQDRQRIAEVIGAESFSFDAEQFAMGQLHAVSPVFIVDYAQEQEELSYYIRNPLHYVKTDRYAPLAMQEQEISTSHGMICLPQNYTTKTPLLYGFMNIGTGKEPKTEYVEDMFEPVVYTGNRKNGQDKQDAFFKRQAKRFKREQFAFAVFVECEEDLLPKKEFAGMGLKKSLFQVETCKAHENDLTKRIQNALGGGDVWYYALSDLVVQNPQIKAFSIVEKKQIRNLQTNFKEKSFQAAVGRNQKQYNIIAAGSVFYARIPKFASNENLEKAGYNQIIKIGGNRNDCQII